MYDDNNKFIKRFFIFVGATMVATVVFHFWLASEILDVIKAMVN